jgi:transcriptional regulator with XRE-family HTH domain
MSAVMQQAQAHHGLKDKILNFLGAGVSPEKVASAVGVDPSYISQLISDPNFAAEVSDRKLLSLQEATNRDRRLDGLEDKLIDKTEKLLESPLAFSRPMESVRALVMINGLKRRGAQGDSHISQNNTVVNLILPNFITTKFTVDVNNQVVQTGDKTFVTVPSKSVQAMAESHLASLPRLGAIVGESHEHPDFEAYR